MCISPLPFSSRVPMENSSPAEGKRRWFGGFPVRIAALRGKRIGFSLVLDDFSTRPETFLPGSETFPPGSETFPPGSENFPPGSENFPTISENFPTMSENFPTMSENFPTRSENFPTRSENFPTRSETFPTRSENFPPGSENFPPGPENFPAGRIVGFAGEGQTGSWRQWGFPRRFRLDSGDAGLGEGVGDGFFAFAGRIRTMSFIQTGGDGVFMILGSGWGGITNMLYMMNFTRLLNKRGQSLCLGR